MMTQEQRVAAEIVRRCKNYRDMWRARGESHAMLRLMPGAIHEWQKLLK